MPIDARTPGAAPTASEAFGRFCAGLHYDALPPMAVERAKHFFIDYIGIALRASTLELKPAGSQARCGTANSRGCDAVRAARSGQRTLGGLRQRHGGAQHGTG